MFSMHLNRLGLTAALLVAGLFAQPRTASARPARDVAQNDAAGRAALVAERQRVRAELERASSEIDALKRSGRGLREDYRLRERLADAEALARRLTELDARLGGTPAAVPHAPAAEPQVSAADGPVEIDAKADILADQAQRLAARGDVLLGRARDLRARQTLRRRVGQMERDPFSPLEGSKRRAMTGSLSIGGNLGGGSTAGTARPAPAAMGATGDKSAPPPGQTTSTEPAGGGLSPPTGGGTSAQPAGGGSPVLTTVGGGNPGASSNAVGQGATGPQGSALSSPPSAPAPTSVSDAASLSVQLRDLLDPTTLAEIQRLETSGATGASTEALERAGAALKARAERLRQQAASLRASQHAAARAR
jgi:hypothetical protein